MQNKIAQLETRLLEISREKSRYQLLNSMLSRLAAVSGLESTAFHILTVLMETVGASNVILYYRINNKWQKIDLFGNNEILLYLPEQLLVDSMESSAPLRENDVKVPYLNGETSTENWYFRLSAHGHNFGVVKMEQMQLTNQYIMDDLYPFFSYAGLMLYSEINNYRQLEQSAIMLNKSESLYRSLFEQLPLSVILWDALTFHARQFNNRACSEMGYTPEEFSKITVVDLDPFYDKAAVKRITSALSEEKTLNMQSVHRMKSGELRDVDIILTQVSIEDNNSVFLEITRDITEEKKKAERIKLLDFALDSIHEAAYLIDESASFKYVNNEACRQLGYSKEELLIMRVYDIDPDFTEDRWPSHWDEMRRDLRSSFESHHRTKAGNVFRIDIRSSFLVYEGQEYILSLVRDIEERQRAEENRLLLERQLQQAQKMESLGVLAGGIAHDFNNILTAIIGNAEIAMMKTGESSPVNENLIRIQKASERAADLARQMLAYSGKGKFITETVNLNRMIEEMLHLIEVSVSKKIRIIYNPSDYNPLADVDPTQIRQIILNLVINASEAIGDVTGEIMISTGSIHLSADEVISYSFSEKLKSGDYIFLTITDSGCGMSEEVQSRIFDPFFTTKFSGRGLGMSAVLGILRSHKGGINVKSAEGSGTRFTVILPVSKSDEYIESAQDCSDFKDCGRVLIVDDEESVRKIGFEILSLFGYEVKAAENGGKALTMIAAAEPPYKIIFLDMTMPEMDGSECLKKIREFDRDIPVIIMSGFSEQIVEEKLKETGFNGFIPKPFTIDSFKRELKKISSAFNQHFPV